MTLRVLHVIDNLGQGGVQRYLLSYLDHMDTSKVVFDFVVQTDVEGCLEEKVHSLGSKVYHLPSAINDRAAFGKRFDRVLRDGDYRIVEAHQNHRCLYPLLVAKRAGVPVRIAHSHSSYPASSFLKGIYRSVFKMRIPHVATELWGCGKYANRWLYGDRLLSKTVVIPNAIDVGRFIYNKENRDGVRSDFGIDGLCLGHVGAGSPAKNYPFIFDLFDEVLRRDCSAKLLLVGCSAESQDGLIGKEIAKRGFDDKVVLTGSVDDPEKYLSAMDVFVLPSLFEGFPIVLVEAQANGLSPIAAAGVVTDETNVTGRVSFIPNEASRLLEWADAVMERAHMPRFVDAGRIAENGYDIAGAAEALQGRYLNLGRMAAQ